eukprot:GDKJ01035497.1.p1 GENE.GDKJ01035497.1~~GDKJ01035497.1.p1  ORF type:complete len:331 (-),score=95.43 GDKJ01035497.1:37-912(-)
MTLNEEKSKLSTGPKPAKLMSLAADEVVEKAIVQEVSQLTNFHSQNGKKGKALEAVVKYNQKVKSRTLVDIALVLGPQLHERRERMAHGDQIVKAILEANKNELPQILDLSGVLLSLSVKQNLFRMIKYSSTIEEFKMSNCELNDADIIVLSKYILAQPKKTLKKLLLGDNRLRSKAAEALGDILATDKLILEGISLEGNNLLRPDIDPAAVEEGEGITCRGVARLAEGLVGASTLKFVDLRRCAIDAMAGQYLAEVVERRKFKGVCELEVRVAHGNFLTKSQEKILKNRI